MSRRKRRERRGGRLKIKDRHIKLALSDRCLNPNIDQLDTSEKMLAYYEAEARRRGIRIIPKAGLFGSDWSKLTTTFWWNIRAGKNYESYSTQGKAGVLAHEWVHVVQWDVYPFFGPRYLGPRWGWAMEMQAYRETIRAMKVRSYTEKEMQDYVDGRAASLWKSYRLMHGIRRKDFDTYTHMILSRELP